MNDPDDDRSSLDMPEPERDGGRREAAHYIMGQVGQLAALARHHQLDMLAYLLDMAKLEARDGFERGPERPK